MVFRGTLTLLLSIEGGGRSAERVCVLPGRTPVAPAAVLRDSDDDYLVLAPLGCRRGDHHR